jgi:hypothetical protein
MFEVQSLYKIINSLKNNRLEFFTGDGPKGNPLYLYAGSLRILFIEDWIG